MAARSFKERVRSLATHPWVLKLLEPATRRSATVFMFHRFSVPTLGVNGASPALLRKGLAFMRAHRFNLTCVGDFAEGLRDGRVPDRTVVFTVDDGYAEFAHVAAPIFAEFDCPVTVFLPTRFMDAGSWMWWDQVSWLLAQADRSVVEVPWKKRTLRFRKGSFHTQYDLNDLVAKLDDAGREELIVRLQDAASAQLPDDPPEAYRPMTWDTVRELGQKGVTFGPHTVTHPIMAQLDHQDIHREVTDSWNRLREETSATVPVFCYPYGRRRHISPQVLEVVEQLGFAGAVSAFPGHLSERHVLSSPQSRFSIPRFGWPTTEPRVRQLVGGLQHAITAIRR